MSVTSHTPASQIEDTDIIMLDKGKEIIIIPSPHNRKKSNEDSMRLFLFSNGDMCDLVT
jgi:hypothetical protein